MIPMAGVRDRLLAITAGAIFLASILTGVLLPVYTDETGWRLQERAAIDGVDIMFNDICGPNTIVHPPWFMMPTRLICAFVNRLLADPLYLRATGVAFAILWAILLWILIGVIEQERSRRSFTRALAFGLLGMGFLPFLMVMSRPEQPLITIAILVTLIALVKVPSRPQLLVAWLKTITIVLLATIAASFHLKGVLYAPVAISCIAICAKGRGTIAPRVIGSVTIVAMTFASALYWVHRFRCPGDAILASQFAMENLAGALSSSAKVPDLRLRVVFGLNPFNYVALALPTNMPMSAWIPRNLFSPAVITVSGIAISTMWMIAGVVGISSLARFLRRTGIRGLIEPRAFIALVILACVMVWGASQLNRNVYEASHILPMLVLFGVLCVSLPSDEKSSRTSVLRYSAMAAVAVGFFSTVAVLGTLAGPLFARAQTPGYVAGQPVSVSIANYAVVQRDIKEAMRKSGMPSDRQLNHLMIDDVTYLALQNSRLPFHWLGVIKIWNGSIKDPVQYLRSRQSDGLVVGCRELPSNMRAAASQSGDICALSRAGLDRLAASPSPVR